MASSLTLYAAFKQLSGLQRGYAVIASKAKPETAPINVFTCCDIVIVNHMKLSI
jgi:hypothetical protein